MQHVTAGVENQLAAEGRRLPAPFAKNFPSEKVLHQLWDDYAETQSVGMEGLKFKHETDMRASIEHMDDGDCAEVTADLTNNMNLFGHTASRMIKEKYDLLAARQPEESGAQKTLWCDEPKHRDRAKEEQLFEQRTSKAPAEDTDDIKKT